MSEQVHGVDQGPDWGPEDEETHPADRVDQVATVEQIARVVHEANRAWQIALGEKASPSWGGAPPWMQLSCIAGVRTALGGATPEQLHEAWVATRLADGWTYGLVKDELNKTHPCLVPYAELPVEQRMKDRLFFAIVAALT